MEEETPGLGIDYKTIDNIRWAVGSPITYFDRQIGDTLSLHIDGTYSCNISNMSYIENGILVADMNLTIVDELTRAITEIVQTNGYGNISDFQSAAADISREAAVIVNRNISSRGIELTRVTILRLDWTEESATRAREVRAQKNESSYNPW